MLVARHDDDDIYIYIYIYIYMQVAEVKYRIILKRFFSLISPIFEKKMR